MVNVEVLCNVKARNSQDLKDIGKLFMLRKLGVVIDDKENYLRNLLRTISDLQESLCSLSITLPIAGCDGTPSSTELQKDIASHLKLKHPPKLLENLSISGTTQKMCLLGLFTKDASNKLAKVTLSNTQLNQDDLKILADLPKLQSVRLRCIVCKESMLTFKKDGFKCLKYLLVEGSNWTEVTFEIGAARELQKLVLSFTNIAFVYGVDGLQKLEELDLNNSSNRSLLLSLFNNAKQIAKLTLYGTLLEQDHLQILARRQKMRCLVLLDKSCVVSKITFNKDEFPKLNLLIVDSSSTSEIIFTSGSAPKLEKIIWSSFTSLSGIDELPRLKELEFNGNIVPEKVEATIRKQKDRLKHNQPENQDQGNGDAPEDDDVARCSFCWKNQV
ncbi:unnamed protein product [Urochloa decumbens]|uniref:Disease resistance R13L4/SHOC-2-like LRR domain-containing protein n=1 Tax=Urochloa decumbens TaxID=240449 RepID=A0ABC9AQQ0_9POAL